MSKEADAPVLTIRRAGDLVEAIPYLLGFHPTESLVLVGLADSRVTVTARLDLDLLTQPGALHEVQGVLANSNATGAIAAMYADHDAAPDRALPMFAEIEVLLRDLAEADITLLDAILVSQQRYYSYFCQDDECCPAGGRSLPGDESSAAATATYAGLVALPDRDSVARALAPMGAAERAELEPLISAAENSALQAMLRGRAVQQTRAAKRAVFSAARLSDQTLFPIAESAAGKEQLCAVAVALTNTAIRDAVWLAVDSRRIDGSELWRQIARAVPDPYAAAPYFLYGWAQWRQGNGTLARIAVGRALDSDPEYSAAQLLGSALDHGLDPRRTPRLRDPGQPPAARASPRRPTITTNVALV